MTTDGRPRREVPATATGGNRTVPEPKTLRFTVPGEARGKARPHVTKGGQHTYTPDPGGFVARVAEYGLAARLEAGQDILTGPVALTVMNVRAIPKGWSKKKRFAMLGQPSPTTPDMNNIVGAVADGLNQIIYEDDRQVFRPRGEKIWGTEHSTHIAVTEVLE